MPLIGFRIGNKTFQRPDFLHALTDTGTSVIILPPKDFKLFIDEYCAGLPAGMSCSLDGVDIFSMNVYITNCN